MGWRKDRLKVLDWPSGEATAADRSDSACLISGCFRKPVDIAYCAEHRIKADDGSLWLRCVFDGGHAPVAPDDPIACSEHRARLDAEPASTGV